MHRHQQQPPAYNPGYDQHGPAANQFQHQSQQQQQPYFNDNRPIQHQQYHQPQGLTPQHPQQQQQRHQKPQQHHQKQRKAKGQSRGGQQGARQAGRVQGNSEISLIVKYFLFFVNLLCWVSQGKDKPNTVVLGQGHDEIVITDHDEIVILT